MDQMSQASADLPFSKLRLVPAQTALRQEERKEAAKEALSEAMTQPGGTQAELGPWSTGQI